MPGRRRGRRRGGPGAGRTNDMAILADALLGAARAVAGGEGRERLSEHLFDEVLDHPSLDVAIGRNEAGIRGVTGDAGWGPFLSLLVSEASWSGAPAGVPGRFDMSTLFALPIVGPAADVLATVGDRDGLLRAMTGSGVLHPATRVAFAAGVLDALGLAGISPGKARATMGLLASGLPAAPDGNAQPELVRLASADPGRVVGVAVVGLSVLRVPEELDPAFADVLNDAGTSTVDRDGAIALAPPLAAAVVAWHAGMLEAKGSAVDVGVPAVVSEAAVELTAMVAERTVARQRGLYGIGRGERASRSLVHKGGGVTACVADFGRGRVLGPVAVPCMVEEYDAEAVVGMLEPLLLGAPMEVFADAGKFAEAVDGLAAGSGLPAPAFPPLAPAVSGPAPTSPPRPRETGNVVGLFDRRPR